MSWEQLYDLLGIKNFIYFISSPTLQEMLFPIKLVFILFTIFLFVAVIWFYINSSYLKFQSSYDFKDFFSKPAFGTKETYKRWKKIENRLSTGSETEFKLAIIEADDFFSNVLDEKGIEGDNFDELLKKAGKAILFNYDEIIQAHQIRNSIVYNPEFKVDEELARKTLSIYEFALKKVMQ